MCENKTHECSVENPCLRARFVTSRLGPTLQNKHYLKLTIPLRSLYSKVFYRATHEPFSSRFTCILRLGVLYNNYGHREPLPGDRPW